MIMTTRQFRAAKLQPPPTVGPGYGHNLNVTSCKDTGQAFTFGLPYIVHHGTPRAAKACKRLVSWLICWLVVTIPWCSGGKGRRDEFMDRDC